MKRTTAAQRKANPLQTDPVLKAVDYLRARTQITPGVGVVLGSGMGSFAERLHSKEVFPYRDIPGFSLSTVPGHAGNLLIGYLKGKGSAVLQGRFHLYEGYTAAQVTFPIRVLASLGVRTLIVTSAAGIVSQKFLPGELMLIRDHLNLMGDHPLRGIKDSRRSIFVEMTAAYDRELIEITAKMAEDSGIPCRQGTLAAVLGPSYETPAEAQMLRSLGADAVCMSGVPEVLMARYLGLRVLGLAVLTNRAGERPAPVTGGPESTGHQQVLEVAAGKTDQVSALLERVVEAVGE